eukprot:3626041-Pyramimonas_sp.AAC.1
MIHAAGHSAEAHHVGARAVHNPPTYDSRAIGHSIGAIGRIFFASITPQTEPSRSPRSGWALSAAECTPRQCSASAYALSSRLPQTRPEGAGNSNERKPPPTGRLASEELAK